MSSGLFKVSPTNYLFTNHIYLIYIYMYEEDLTFNKLKELMCYKNQPIKFELDKSWVYFKNQHVFDSWTHTHTCIKKCKCNVHFSANECDTSWLFPLLVELRICWLYPPCRGVRLSLPSKRSVLGMTMNCIWSWGSSSGILGCVEYLFTALTPRSTLIQCGSWLGR